MRTKIEGYDKERQMYRCDETDKEICKNCFYWQYTETLPTVKNCTRNMDSISMYMSCDNFKDRNIIEVGKIHLEH
jgi:hypothetical protein